MNQLAKVAKEKGWELLEDTNSHQYRIQIAGSSGNLYIVSQTKLNKIWMCSCLGYRRHKHCKHLDAMRPALESAVKAKEIA